MTDHIRSSGLSPQNTIQPAEPQSTQSAQQPAGLSPQELSEITDPAGTVAEHSAPVLTEPSQNSQPEQSLSAEAFVKSLHGEKTSSDPALQSQLSVAAGSKVTPEFAAALKDLSAQTDLKTHPDKLLQLYAAIPADSSVQDKALMLHLADLAIAAVIAETLAAGSPAEREAAGKVLELLQNLSLCTQAKKAAALRDELSALLSGLSAADSTPLLALAEQAGTCKTQSLTKLQDYAVKLDSYAALKAADMQSFERATKLPEPDLEDGQLHFGHWTEVLQSSVYSQKAQQLEADKLREFAVCAFAGNRTTMAELVTEEAAADNPLALQALQKLSEDTAKSIDDSLAKMEEQREVSGPHLTAWVRDIAGTARQLKVQQTAIHAIEQQAWQQLIPEPESDQVRTQRLSQLQDKISRQQDLLQALKSIQDDSTGHVTLQNTLQQLQEQQQNVPLQELLQQLSDAVNVELFSELEQLTGREDDFRARADTISRKAEKFLTQEQQDTLKTLLSDREAAHQLFLRVKAVLQQVHNGTTAMAEVLGKESSDTAFIAMLQEYSAIYRREMTQELQDKSRALADRIQALDTSGTGSTQEQKQVLLRELMSLYADLQGRAQRLLSHEDQLKFSLRFTEEQHDNIFRLLSSLTALRPEFADMTERNSSEAFAMLMAVNGDFQVLQQIAQAYSSSDPAALFRDYAAADTDDKALDFVSRMAGQCFLEQTPDGSYISAGALKEQARNILLSLNYLLKQPSPVPLSASPFASADTENATDSAQSVNVSDLTETDDIPEIELDIDTADVQQRMHERLKASRRQGLEQLEALQGTALKARQRMQALSIMCGLYPLLQQITPALQKAEITLPGLTPAGQGTGAPDLSQLQPETFYALCKAAFDSSSPAYTELKKYDLQLLAAAYSAYCAQQGTEPNRFPALDKKFCRNIAPEGPEGFAERIEGINPYALRSQKELQAVRRTMNAAKWMRTGLVDVANMLAESNPHKQVLDLRDEIMDRARTMLKLVRADKKTAQNFSDLGNMMNTLKPETAIEEATMVLGLAVPVLKSTEGNDAADAFLYLQQAFLQYAGHIIDSEAGISLLSGQLTGNSAKIQQLKQELEEAKALQQGSPARIHHLLRIARNLPLKGETLAVNLLMLQMLLVSDVSQLSAGQLEELGLDRDKLFPNLQGMYDLVLRDENNCRNSSSTEYKVMLHSYMVSRFGADYTEENLNQVKAEKSLNISVSFKDLQDVAGSDVRLLSASALASLGLNRDMLQPEPAALQEMYARALQQKQQVSAGFEYKVLLHSYLISRFGADYTEENLEQVKAELKLGITLSLNDLQLFRLTPAQKKTVLAAMPSVYEDQDKFAGSTHLLAYLFSSKKSDLLSERKQLQKTPDADFARQADSFRQNFLTDSLIDRARVALPMKEQKQLGTAAFAPVQAKALKVSDKSPQEVKTLSRNFMQTYVNMLGSAQRLQNSVQVKDVIDYDFKLSDTQQKLVTQAVMMAVDQAALMAGLDREQFLLQLENEQGGDLQFLQLWQDRLQEPQQNTASGGSQPEGQPEPEGQSGRFGQQLRPEDTPLTQYLVASMRHLGIPADKAQVLLQQVLNDETLRQERTDFRARKIKDLQELFLSDVSGKSAREGKKLIDALVLSDDVSGLLGAMIPGQSTEFSSDKSGKLTLKVSGAKVSAGGGISNALTLGRTTDSKYTVTVSNEYYALLSAGADLNDMLSAEVSAKGSGTGSVTFTFLQADQAAGFAGKLLSGIAEPFELMQAESISSGHGAGVRLSAGAEAKLLSVQDSSEKLQAELKVSAELSGELDVQVQKNPDSTVYTLSTELSFEAKATAKAGLAEDDDDDDAADISVLPEVPSFKELMTSAVSQTAEKITDKVTEEITEKASYENETGDQNIHGSVKVSPEGAEAELALTYGQQAEFSLTTDPADTRAQKITATYSLTNTDNEQILQDFCERHNLPPESRQKLFVTLRELRQQEGLSIAAVKIGYSLPPEQFPQRSVGRQLLHSLLQQKHFVRDSLEIVYTQDKQEQSHSLNLGAFNFSQVNSMQSSFSRTLEAA